MIRTGGSQSPSARRDRGTTLECDSRAPHPKGSFPLGRRKRLGHGAEWRWSPWPMGSSNGSIRREARPRSSAPARSFAPRAPRLSQSRAIRANGCTSGRLPSGERRGRRALPLRVGRHGAHRRRETPWPGAPRHLAGGHRVARHHRGPLTVTDTQPPQLTVNDTVERMNEVNGSSSSPTPPPVAATSSTTATTATTDSSSPPEP